MNVFSALLTATIPVILLAWIGSRVRSGTDEKQDRERWLFFLLGAITLLLTGMIASILSFNNRTPASFFLFLPCLWGAIAATLLHLFSGNRVWPRNHLTWALLVITLVLLIGLGFVGEPSILPIVVVGSALTALVWQAWRWVDRWTLAAYLVLVVLLLLGIWHIDTHRPLFENPAWLVSTIQNFLAFAPAAAIIVAARLLQMGLGDGKPIDPRRLALALVSVLLILFLIGYQTVIASIWDVATDGLGGIFLVGTTSLAGIAAALLLAWKLTSGRKLAAILFAAIVPLTMIGAERLGTLDLNGKWGTLPGQVTEARAEKIDHALQKFYTENGTYPQSLNELTPRYLLYIPVPYIIPSQDWCYQGGGDYYRFGYVHREMFSLPASVRIYSSEGKPPDPAWNCDQEAAKYQDVPGF
jgi:MFS family permease